ncbi:hypothetical protein [Sphingobium sp. CCH11-B1]|jgi:hypothetical protein|uniref:hypothetical protein n=1 Tax=Sphingobium sp. CCH11-B1 TaxID=1768781 RepID=UPI000A877FD5|nr:hypothetical protein [Sphingobium sp. CCH11-B1]MEA3391022.1 hypothetical protein [Pseudomonadota bacterium]
MAVLGRAGSAQGDFDHRYEDISGVMRALPLALAFSVSLWAASAACLFGLIG